MVIYKITHIETNRAYVGQTTGDVQARWRRHATSDTHLGRAIKKYGKQAFLFEVLAELATVEELNEKEIELIAKHCTIIPNGFNIEIGGKNAPMSEGAKLKMSMVHKGKTIAPEHKQALSKANKNKVVSDATRQKMRASRLGKKASSETKRKIGESNKYKVFLPKTEEQKKEITRKNLIRAKDSGVTAGYSKREDAYIGRVVFCGKDIKKSFSVKVYGKDLACKMATEFRAALIDECLEKLNVI